MFEKIKTAWKGSKIFANSIVPTFDSLGETGQAMNTILTLIVAGIGLVIGVYVFSEVEGSMDYSTGGWVDNIVGDLYGAYGLTPVVLIVLVAGAILSVLMTFRG